MANHFRRRGNDAWSALAALTLAGVITVLHILLLSIMQGVIVLSVVIAYELVRRRVGTIVLCDNGCDPNFRFDDLGNQSIRGIHERIH